MQFARWCWFALAVGSVACGSRLSVGDLGNDATGSSTGTMDGGVPSSSGTSTTASSDSSPGVAGGNPTSAGGMGGSTGLGGAPMGGAAGSAGDPNPVGTPLTDLVGSWKGYVENFQFSDQSDAVLLAITSAAGAGQITFGSSAAPPPATDPNVGYPPGIKFDGLGRPSGAQPGFAFTLAKVTFDGQRLQFDVATKELWKQWCEL